MADEKRGGTGSESAADGGAVQRVVTGAAKALGRTVQAITGGFRALVGKSSGSIRAVGLGAQVIYLLAPAMIRRAHRGLADDEVDEVVELLIDDELTMRSPEWSFVSHPDLRPLTIVRAIRRYIRGKGRRWKKGARADGAFLAEQDPEVAWAHPAARLEHEEAQAILDAVMQRMSPTRRAIYTAVRLEGWSHKELAAATGWSVQYIKKQMTRANQMVAKAAREFEEGRRSTAPKRGRPRKITEGAPA